MMKTKNSTLKLPSLRIAHMCKIVGRTKSFADVGCDHGFVSIYLAYFNKAKQIYACDISENCVDKARANAKKFGVYDKVNFVVSNGLESLNVNYLSTVLIAGMGGEEIVKIIQNKSAKLKIKNFILQPATKVLYLKQWLTENGFKIQKDEILEEKNKFYCFLKIKRGKSKLNKLELLFGKKNLKKPSLTFKKYLANFEEKTQKYFNQGHSKQLQEQLFLINEAKRRIYNDR